MMGRPPKSAALKAIDGDTSQRGATKHAEAVKALGDIPKGLPEAPETLSAGGRKIWDGLMNCAGAEKLFREADGGTLAAYCELYAAFNEAIQVKDYREAGNLSSKWLPLSDRLGLSPVARARLQLGTEGDKLARPDAAAWKARKAG